MLATTVVEREDFIGNTIYLIMGVGIHIAALIIGLFSVTILYDIKKLNQAVQRISTGETDVRIEVRWDDEIDELSDSFERMVTSLKIMAEHTKENPMTELAQQVTAIAINYLGPAANVFLQRQAKMHLEGLAFAELERKHLPNLQY